MRATVEYRTMLSIVSFTSYDGGNSASFIIVPICMKFFSDVPIIAAANVPRKTIVIAGRRMSAPMLPPSSMNDPKIAITPRMRPPAVVMSNVRFMSSRQEIHK